jgi:hypothetical protein
MLKRIGIEQFDTLSKTGNARTAEVTHYLNPPPGGCALCA